jgi:hypothetical protein
MDPANILFIVAFIGLPIAFGVWAMMSRRELKSRPPAVRNKPPETMAVEDGVEVAEQEHQPRPRRRRRRKPRQPDAAPQQTSAMPAAPSADQQPTVQAPAVAPAPEPAPAAPPPRPQEPAPAAPAEPVNYGPSGTTEEFPIIADGVMPEAPPPPVEQETVTIPAYIPAEGLVAAEISPPPPVPQPTPDSGLPQQAGNDGPQTPPPPAPRPAVYGLLARRRYYPVRYVAPSGGVVKRMTPLDERVFVRSTRVRR